MNRKEEKRDPESPVRDIRRNTRRKFSADEKIRIVLEGLRGEQSIADLCRKESIHPSRYHKWSKEFLESGKNRLTANHLRQATSDEVKELREENANDTKQAVWMHLQIKKDNQADHKTVFLPANAKMSCILQASFLKNPVVKLPLKSLINTKYGFFIS